MDSLFLNSFAANGFIFPRIRRNVYFLRLKLKFSVFAAKKEDPKFDQWDLMELKFGKMLGEDPKLTLAKITGRKVNPDASYLEIEKQFYNSKGKLLQVREVPFDENNKHKSSSTSSLDALNLARPVPKNGIKFQTNVPKMNKPSPSAKKAIDNRSKTSSVPNVILRKPNMVNEEGVTDIPSSRLRMKPNLSLNLRNENENEIAKEQFSDMTLLRRPKPTSVDMKQDSSSYSESKVIDDGVWSKTNKEEPDDNNVDFTLLKKPAASVQRELNEKQEQFGNAEAQLSYFLEEKSLNAELEATKPIFQESLDIRDGPISKETKLKGGSNLGMKPAEQSKKGFSNGESFVNESSQRNLEDSSVSFATESAILEKPKRLGLSAKERVEIALVNPVGYGDDIDINSLHSISPIGEHEDSDWTKAEDLVKTGERVDVELISSSTRGFVVFFGSLIGFLPYRNLAAKWKFLAFESWLRRKGLDPSMYRQNLGIIGNYDPPNKTFTLASSLDQESDQKVEGEILPNMKLEHLLKIYDQEKLKFLSSFVGQKIKVNVIMVDRKFKKVIFSVRPKEKEELVEKKRSLMAKLRVGDVVKCCIKKITYFGVFVEVEGVPALIHQTEVSWDATLDPASYFKIGQVVEAKVHQLDFALERIFLSLKEIMPDPLTEALESVVGGRDPLDGRLEAAQADTEWDDVESIIKELQQIEGVESVSKGRFFLSPGLAPTFQVYMTSMFDNQYKLLARSGKKVQEVKLSGLNLIVSVLLVEFLCKYHLTSCTLYVVICKAINFHIMQYIFMFLSL
ncbi:hypothetical protein Ddye_008556 [Dipteronia dyeriana]|uniref:S1 motif domain-containing protein n=1 Tax=Dipteronia dyeriana TaxID=168575 RepID=A0AAD9X9S8_9ROSI|nr:hypothetical protein Ddye_008556 [Dipteronia dyeriana]